MHIRILFVCITTFSLSTYSSEMDICKLVKDWICSAEVLLDIDGNKSRNFYMIVKQITEKRINLIRALQYQMDLIIPDLEGRVETEGDKMQVENDEMQEKKRELIDPLLLSIYKTRTEIDLQFLREIHENYLEYLKGGKDGTFECPFFMWKKNEQK